VPVLTVPPRLRVEIVRDAHAANEGDLAVDRQQLAVVAQQGRAPAAQAERVVQSKVHACCDQALTVFATQPVAAEVIDQQVHRDSTACSSGKRGDELLRDGPGDEEVHLQEHSILRFRDRVQHRRDECSPIDLERVEVWAPAREGLALGTQGKIGSHRKSQLTMNTAAITATTSADNAAASVCRTRRTWIAPKYTAST
jgi:hypothetical protein